MASFRKMVMEMGVGDKITIPVAEVGYSTIRSYASDLGFALERRYSTTRNRIDRTYTITRLA